MRNKNVPSNNPEYRKRMRVQKELTELLHAEGHGTLFPSASVMPEKSRAKYAIKRERLIRDGIKYGFWVPQALIDEVNPPPEENPRVPDEDDDGKAPSGRDDDDGSDEIPI